MGVPVAVAPLAGRDTEPPSMLEGRQVRMRREQSGPHLSVLAHHPGILLSASRAQASSSLSTEAQPPSSFQPGLG